ncbi:hypothetical protein ABZ532_27595 [Streptomyces sp. NPDC019396]|uniref:hypothetical protein n=1 Tax=Streptomyces sp. NPDC019396 TaxID=3154687 RepID=UPI0034032134
MNRVPDDLMVLVPGNSLVTSTPAHLDTAERSARAELAAARALAQAAPSVLDEPEPLHG